MTGNTHSAWLLLQLQLLIWMIVEQIDRESQVERGGHSLLDRTTEQSLVWFHYCLSSHPALFTRHKNPHPPLVAEKAREFHGILFMHFVQTHAGDMSLYFIPDKNTKEFSSMFPNQRKKKEETQNIIGAIWMCFKISYIPSCGHERGRASQCFAAQKIKRRREQTSQKKRKETVTRVAECCSPRCIKD